MIMLFLIETFLNPIFLRILKEAPDHQDHDYPNRESRNDTHRLDVVHTALTEHQGDRKYDQQDTPEQRDHSVRLLVLIQFLIAIRDNERLALPLLPKIFRIVPYPNYNVAMGLMDDAANLHLMLRIIGDPGSGKTRLLLE